MVYDWLLRHWVLVFAIFGIVYLLITFRLEHKKKRKIIMLGVYLIILGPINFVYMSTVGLGARVRGTIGGVGTFHSSSPSAHSFHLPKDAYVEGTITHVEDGNLDIDFYVFDETNYNLWKNGYSYAEYVFMDRVETGVTFSFQTDKADDYIFVSHNPDWTPETGGSVKYSASYGSKPYSPYAIPVAIILSVTGVIVVVSGYLTKQKQIVPAVPTVYHWNYLLHKQSKNQLEGV